MPALIEAARRGLALLGATIIFTAAGYFVGSAFIDHQNRGQLSDLTEFVLHRAELEVDFAFMGLGELVEAGAASCDRAALSAMRRQVYVRSTIKDIRVVDEMGTAICAAFPETLLFDDDVAHQDKAIPARNTFVRLFRLTQTSSASLGVLWRVVPELSLLAVLNTDALLFDVVPSTLQGQVAIRLELSNGDIVASYATREVAGEATVRAVELSAVSDRYPISVTLTLDPAVLSGWNRDLLLYFVIPAALVGAAFGALLARLLVPAKTPLSEIDAALAAGEIVPFVQPVFDLASSEIVGCEVLARWVRRDGTVVAPYLFIPLIEQSGRIRTLTWVLFETALSQLRSVILANPSFTVAFNIAPSHFLHSAFSDEVRSLVSQANIPPRQIILEITERQELPDLKHAAEVIKGLVQDGFAVAIDDAGTGHSGLTYVQTLGAQILKVDKFFVDAVETEHSARVIVEMLVGAAHELGMSVVAEGIEQEGQLAWLRTIGVEHGQGYLVSRPLPISELAAQLAQRRRGEASGSEDARIRTA